LTQDVASQLEKTYAMMDQSRSASVDPDRVPWILPLKWALPPCFCALCFLYQSVMLHLATFHYVSYVTFDPDYYAQYKFAGKGAAGPTEYWLEGERGAGEKSCYEAVMHDDRCEGDYFTYNARGDGNCGCRGASGEVPAVRSDENADHYRINRNELHDVGHAIFGVHDTNTSKLDAFAVVMVVIFCASTFLLSELRIWVKVFVSLGLLFLLKGTLDSATVLPDSGGWEKCKERLSNNGRDDGVIDTFVGLQNATDGERLLALIRMDLSWFQGSPVRYCSDMLLSGHTFCMLLPLLACCDLFRKLTRYYASKGTLSHEHARAIEMFMYAVAIVLAGTEGFLIVSSRFHYTVDVMLAVVATLLLYTNAGLALFIDRYVEAGLEEHDPMRTGNRGILWVPGFCIPFCCFGHYYEVREAPTASIKFPFTHSQEFSPEDSPEEAAPLLSPEEASGP